MIDVPPHPDLEGLYPASFGWALACCGHDREEASEVLQEVYLSVLEGKARFEGRSSPRTWLFSVIRRTAVSRRRRNWLRRLALGRWLDGRNSPPAQQSAETALGATEATAAIRLALAELTERQRQVLHLVFYQDLTVEQASRVLGISVGSARTHYHRGKEALRRRLPRGLP